ncbi:50S ribosomal protein L11 methyltransferase [Tamilnaduibacter salinus]|uniref:Ribosomal protein L11 methyltransferase n=1 Tax=Tamilnaduibacter salinus TaxID=1484056 RepID=A0A2A2I0S2_9GAMM|nr:50S ribosomal protein L11 methyltransferase [Tamilnaduibacter salinus]PAV24613.1 50S ribosomal protein L11 methyltransferase [Tamilnaduibacter salinus]
MRWIQLHVPADPDHAELVEELLMGAGAEAVTMEDAADQPLFEPEPGTTPLWNQTRVTGLFQTDENMEGIRALLQDQYHQQTQQTLGHIEVELLEDRDWERAWMDDFQPIRFGQRLWIVPSWHSAPDPDAANLVLDPGLAFGTGTHQTTALCLEWLDGQDLTGQQVIDYGCGSGILGLAALLLGARHFVGVDTDPQALEATRENTRRNEIDESRVALYLPDNDPEMEADLVLANILAQPLMSLAGKLASRVREGGWIVLSGILSEQAVQVADAYDPWFDMQPPTEKEGWVCITGRRRDR